MEIPSNITLSTVDPVLILRKVETLSQGRRQAIIFGIVGIVTLTAYGAVHLKWSHENRKTKRDLELQEYNEYRKSCHEAEIQEIKLRREILHRELLRLPGPVTENTGALANVGRMLAEVSSRMVYKKQPP